MLLREDEVAKEREEEKEEEGGKSHQETRPQLLRKCFCFCLSAAFLCAHTSRICPVLNGEKQTQKQRLAKQLEL